MTTGMFTARQGRPAPGGTFEGVPDHLRKQLTRWLESVYVINAQGYFAGWMCLPSNALPPFCASRLA